jgi:hypothetical protein
MRGRLDCAIDGDCVKRLAIALCAEGSYVENSTG